MNRAEGALQTELTNRGERPTSDETLARHAFRCAPRASRRSAPDPGGVSMEVPLPPCASASRRVRKPGWSAGWSFRVEGTGGCGHRTPVAVGLVLPTLIGPPSRL